MRTQLRYFFFLSALLTAVAGQAQATEITVTEITENEASCTLDDAIKAANKNKIAGKCPAGSREEEDTIILETNVVLAEALSEITSTITIEGGGHTIDGNNVGSVLCILEYGDLTLNEVTVTGGMNVELGYGGGIDNNFGTVTLNSSTVNGNFTTEYGGGINNYFGIVTLNSSTINGNSATRYGGGINNDEGTVTLNSSTINGNSTTNYGGGIDNYKGTVTLTDSTVSVNSANYGGGIDNYKGTVTLTDSTVSENSAKDNGGGILNHSSTVTLNNSTVSGNSAGYGGGIDNYSGGTVTLTNSTVSDNSAVEDGGGIENGNSTVTLTNSTVTRNSAADYGGGIENYYGGTVTLSSSIVSGNTADTEGNEVWNDDDTSSVIADSFNLFGDNSETDTQAYNFTPGDSDVTATSDGTNPTALASILSDLADNGGPTKTHALVANSPAIDLDTSCGTGLTTDQRGQPRPVGAGCDAGSFEFNADSDGNDPGGNDSTFLQSVYFLLL